MRFTVASLYKRLGKLIEQGHGRKPVAVNKPSFVHICEADGAVILELAGLGIKWISLIDDDGGPKYRADGTESGRNILVLAGCAGANMKGELVSVYIDELP
jgi:hypothetical protein